MKTTKIDCDYLVIGAGAMGMAFVDEMMHQDENATFIIVDRQNRPGGHWNVAYPFVSLHQPAAFYGVNSRQLGHGDNRLASHLEVTAYYESVMSDMLDTGRVRFYPLCEYKGDYTFASVRSPETLFTVNVHRRLVDAGHLEVKVPANTPPPFAYDDDVKPQPPNVLAARIEQYEDFVIIGAGKTAIDSILYLIDSHVAPQRIKWIKPSESWLYDRGQCQTATFPALVGAQMGASLKAQTMDEFYQIMESYGGVHRIYEDVPATKFRCATVSEDELQKCRSVTNVIRMGKISKIESNRIVMEKGDYPTSANNLHINCTAKGLTNSEKIPVFTPEKITLQAIFTCQQVFSAALIGFIEANYEEDSKRNAVAGDSCWFPEEAEDMLPMTLDTAANLIRWEREPELKEWLSNSRLYVCSYVSEQEYNSRIGSNLNLLKMPGVTKQLRALFDQHYPDIPFPLDAIYDEKRLTVQKGKASSTRENEVKQFWVEKEDITRTQIVERELEDLAEGQIRLKIAKFGLTANNISYALGGDLLSFWEYYPADEKHGIIPVWGIGEVIESKADGIHTGERIWGFMPMSNYVTLTVGELSDAEFSEGSGHRASMPVLYNKYLRLNANGELTERSEDWLSILRWLFMTSYLISEQVESSDLDEKQIIIDTASSKTALGTAFAFKRQARDVPKLIGLTSARNLDFVKSLEVYDQVLTYDQVAEIATGVNTVNLNFSGNYDIIRSVHSHLENDLVLSLNIGLAHWENVDSAADLLSPQPGVVGPMPMPFLMFNRVLEIEQKWGAEELQRRYQDYLDPFLEFVECRLKLRTGSGSADVIKLYDDVLKKRVNPEEGVLLSVA